MVVVTPRLADSPTAPASVPPRRVQWWWVALALAAAVLLVLAVPRFVNTSATTVPRVTFTNNSRYDFDVAVTDARRDGTVDLGTVRADSSTSFNDVVDQGATWIFAVDTHDAFPFDEHHPDREAWTRLQVGNRLLKEAIERSWEADGLLTFNGLLRQGLTGPPPVPASD